MTQTRTERLPNAVQIVVSTATLSREHDDEPSRVVEGRVFVD
jgi:hypothetical protein